MPQCQEYDLFSSGAKTILLLVPELKQRGRKYIGTNSTLNCTKEKQRFAQTFTFRQRFKYLYQLKPAENFSKYRHKSQACQ